jgi:hypothetical protein
VGDFLEVFEADDGEGGGGEAMLAAVLRGAGLAFRGAGAGGLGGVGAIGRELFLGDGLFGTGFGAWHAICPPIGDIAQGRGLALDGDGSSDRNGGVYFVVSACEPEAGEIVDSRLGCV